jgi:O-antigen/teichoic acid export membrane protein
MNSLRSQAFWHVLGTVLNLGFPILTFPYISRLLGPANLGEVNYVDSLVQLVIFIAALGIPYYGMKEIAQAKKDPIRQASILYQLLTINFLFIFIGALFFTIYVLAFSAIHIDNELLFYALVVILTQPLMADWFFAGNQEFIFLIKRNVAVRLITLICIFLFIQNRNDYINYYGLLVGAQVLQSFWNLYSYSRLRPFKFFYLNDFKNHFKPITVLFAATAFISLYVYLDTVILGNIAGTKVVGFYSVGMKIIRLSLYIISAGIAVLFPAIAILIQEKEMGAMQQMINKAIQAIILLGLPIFLGMLLFAKPFVYLFAGDEFSEAAVTIMILSPLPMIIGLSNLFGLQILIPLGKEINLLKAVSITTVLALFLQIILATYFSFVGTALATLITEFFVLSLTFFYVKKNITLTVPSAFWKACLLFLAGCMPICLAVHNWIKNDFIQLGVGCSWLLIWGSFTLYIYRDLLWKGLLGSGTWIPLIGKRFRVG